MSDHLHCPTCGRRTHRGDFLCPACETILDSSAFMEDPEPPLEPTLVRALLSPPEATLKRKIPEPPPELRENRAHRRGTTKTRLFTLPFEAGDVPTISMGLDLKGKSLSSFEAYIVSLVDGRSSIDQLRQITALSRIEVQSIVRSLVDRGIVRIKEPAVPRPRPAPLPPPPAPPLLRRADGDRPARPPPPTADLPYEAVTTPHPMPDERQQRAVAAVPLSPPVPLPAPPAPASKGARTREGDAPTAPRGIQPAGRSRRQPEHVFEPPLEKAIRLEREGKVAEAIQVLERAIAGSRDPAPLYNRLALALIKERRDLVRAEEMLHKALELDPVNDVYTKNLMKVLAMAAAVTGRKKRPRR